MPLSTRVRLFIRGNVLGFIAIFIALGGVSWAAGLAKDSVKSKHIKDGQVKTNDLRDGSVVTVKLADGSVTTAKITDGAVTGDKVDESTLGQVPSATSADTASDAQLLDGLDSTDLQKRVTTDCGAGAAIRSVNTDGTAACSTGSTGDITSVAAGNGITGGGTTGDVTISTDSTVVQNRVLGACASGSSIRVINQNGSVNCQTDTSGGTPSGAAGGDLAGTYPNPTLKAPVAWTAIPLDTGWTVGIQTPQCYRDLEGVAHLRGATARGAGADTTPFTQLPAACRPDTSGAIVGATLNNSNFANGFYAAYATPGGDFTIDFGAPVVGAGSIALDGITWRNTP